MESKPFVSAMDHFGEKLPVGFKSQNNLLNAFEFGSLKGKLRRELLNVRNPFRATIVALRHVLTKLGTVLTPPESLVENVPACDGDYLQFLLSTSRLEGGIFPIEATCGDPDLGMGDGCGAPIKGQVPAANVGFVEGSAPILYHPVTGLPYQEITFSYLLPSGEEAAGTVKCRIATLKDQAGFIERAEATVASKKIPRDRIMGDFVNSQFAALMIDFDGRGSGLSVEELDNLDIRLYDALVFAMNSHNPPHVDLDVDLRCAQCGRIHRVDLPIRQWLDPFVVPKPNGN